MYFIIELQATSALIAENANIIVPSFITTLLPNGEEVIPVFLSKLHAHMYLSSIKKLDEFQIVDINNINLSGYVSVYKELKRKTDEFFKYNFYVAVSLNATKEGNEELTPVYLKKQYKGYDIFCNSESVEKEALRLIPENLRSIIHNHNRLNNNEIITRTQSCFTSSKPVSIKVQTLFKKIKSNLFTKKRSPTKYDKRKDTNVGRMRVFMLIDKFGNAYSSVEKGKHEICFFVNKLDAAITQLIELEKDKKNKFKIFQVEEDNAYFKLLKKMYEKGKINFAISHGFMCINDGIEPKWGSTISNQSIPNMLVRSCEPQDIEKGYDLKDYFLYMQGDKEIENAISGLLNTSMATEEELTKIAKKILSDMKVNTVFVPENKCDRAYNRLAFVGS